MFACPQCQFKNPVHNRFCQRCGSPLKSLQAIITRESEFSTNLDGSDDFTIIEKANQHLNSSGEVSAIARMTLPDLLATDNYIDCDKRYQLRYPPEENQLLSEESELAIIDCRPAEESPLIRMMESDSTESEDTPLEHLEDILPPLAYPYWQLQDQFFPVIPELQAAWQDASFTILVLEDRSAWRQLSEAWQLSTLEPLELVHWFYEMGHLWDSLVAFEAEPSLLSHQNLLIDDDQILCLRRLLYRPKDRTYDIKDLGLFWQSLLQQFPNNSLTALETLAMDIVTGTVMDTAAIKDRLASIADDLQGKISTENQEGSEELAQEIEIEVPDTCPPILEIEQAEDVPAPIEEASSGTKTLEEIDDELLVAEDEVDDGEIEAADEGISDLPTMALPVTLFRLDEVGHTHVGRQRTHNEDSFYAETDLQRVDSPLGLTLKARGLYILCDGMGGHAGGEIASMLAVDTLRTYFETHWQADLPDEETIKAGILQANQAIFEKNEAEERTGSARMGTTLVMVLLADNQAVVAHVGDSRLYCFTRHGLKQLTVDHEVGQREIN
ncbi:MAG: serine/threonine phosphatase, partial [Leptolyngbya sp. SIO1D8]|nr:serine/threonine phosphatase [Leptolyngbya sp. SIO1D8]